MLQFPALATNRGDVLGEDVPPTVESIDSHVAPRDDTPDSQAPRFTIRVQLMAPLAVVGVLGLASVALAYGLIAQHATTARIEQRLQGVVSVLQQRQFPLTDAVLSQMADLAGAELLLADEQGKTLAASDSSLATDELKTAVSVEISAQRVELGPAVTTPDGRFLHMAVELQRPGPSRTPGTLHVLFPRRDYHAAWWAAIAPPLVVGALMIVSTALVVNSIAGRIGRTLAILGGAVGQLSEASDATPPKQQWPLTARYPLATRYNDETRDLANSVLRAGSRMHQYETDLRRTERLRAVSMLGAGLAHEMRNAATGCRLAIDLHAEDCPRRAEDDCLAVARRQLRSLESRLQQLLQLGRQPGARSSQVVDLSSVVSEAVDIVRPAARHNRLRLDWTPSAPLPVDACPEQLLQSTVNLLLNAVEAASRGRRNVADGAFVRVDLSSQEGEALLRVIDSGDGPQLPAGEDCFDPFISQKPEGVGMGLSVCRSVVENAGGRVRWSRAGGTTEFLVQLPIALGELQNA